MKRLDLDFFLAFLGSRSHALQPPSPQISTGSATLLPFAHLLFFISLLASSARRLISVGWIDEHIPSI